MDRIRTRVARSAGFGVEVGASVGVSPGTKVAVGMEIFVCVEAIGVVVSSTAEVEIAGFWQAGMRRSANDNNIAVRR
jgi:hypothetical protein